MSEKSTDVKSSLSGQFTHFVREPFRKQTWSEFLYLSASISLAYLGLSAVLVSMALGTVLAVTFVGLAVLALSVRLARWVGRVNRGLGRSLLGLQISEPEPFEPRKGFLGWLQSSLRDATGWRALGYLIIKVPLSFLGVYAAISLWFSAYICFSSTFQNQTQMFQFGIVRLLFFNTFTTNNEWSPVGWIATFLFGCLLVCLAPWAVRLVISVDRYLMNAFLSRDPMTDRVKSLEHARTHSVDESAATLRRI